MWRRRWKRRWKKVEDVEDEEKEVEEGVEVEDEEKEVEEGVEEGGG